MKKILLNLLFPVAITVSTEATAQIAVSTLFQNFDVACTATTGFPPSWLLYNPLSATIPQGQWTCSPLGGRDGTPGIQCTGVYGGFYNLDTSYLITPMMNISGVSGSVYMDFDTKTDKVTLGGDLSIIVIVDSPYADTVDFTSSIVPAIGIADSLGWVTHQINLTPLKDSANFYVTFRYTSTITRGSMWFLDNVNTTSDSYSLNIPELKKEELPITILGNSTSSQISLAYTLPGAGIYFLTIYDMLGQQVYKETINGQGGIATKTINGLNLHNGMYFIKMGDGATYGVAKTVVN